MLPEPASAAEPKEAAARLRLIIDSAPVALIVVDRTGRIILANRQALHVFGYQEAELVGRGVNLLVPAHSRRLHHLQMESFFEAGVPRSMGGGREVLGVDRNGREFPIEVGLTPVQSETGPLAVAAIIDITERRRVETESTLARIVQQAMLPKSQPVFAGCDIFGMSKAADATGGDFFDFIPLSDDRLGVVIGDASGHGFAAALVTASARSYLRALSRTEKSLTQILGITNQLLCQDLTEGRFVTLFYAVLDPGQLTIKYAGAGHSVCLFSAQGHFKQLLDSSGPALGWFATMKIPSKTIAIDAGDILLLTTDGIEEAMSASGELFGRERILEILHEHASEPAAEIVRALYAAVRRFRASQLDDATAIIVKFPP
jgi:PAS domain S-box-containing protein